ncbi:putative Calnexin like protein [Blattamonas nauphoetae]|uniref:Calnexin like protein n=1 Tax=Blattamonas nauphoetae TaxID=2049346 RepID=A0ABQ9YGI1_9EUKA|nr:putative Calnexin like protein [Blattamonas nauphoetae]
MMFLYLFPFFHMETYLYDSFDDESVEDRWIISENPRYTGSWAVEPRIVDVLNDGKKGLVTKGLNSLHGISTKCEFNHTNGTFVLQYFVKFQPAPFHCGGAYLKLINQPFSPTSFSNNTKYAVMFGPDVCGYTKQVHFIVRTKNPRTGFWDEHRLMDVPLGLYNNVTHAYRLVIREDDTFSIYVDGKEDKYGVLNDYMTFEPPFSPTENILDKTDEKPDNWDEREFIPDPSISKPDDWDDTQPEFIPNLSIKKPENWNDNAPHDIIDPTATKPESWNDEEDGEWIPPTIPNEICQTEGCGEWVQPIMKNPLFKGVWQAPEIENPNFQGIWRARSIPNPAHFVAEDIHKLGKIYGVGFDLLGVEENVMFTHLYIGNSEQEADDILNREWKPLFEKEDKQLRKITKKLRKEHRREQLEGFWGVPFMFKVEMLKQYVLDWIEDNRILSVIFLLSVLFLLFLSLGLCIRKCCGKKETIEPKKKTEEDDTTKKMDEEKTPKKTERAKHSRTPVRHENTGKEGDEVKKRSTKQKK